LGIMKTFRVYKPALPNAAFLELQHCGSSYLDLVGRSVAFAGQPAGTARPPAATPPAPARRPDPAATAIEDAVEKGLRDFDL
jgi:hypothetical protein